MTFIIAVHVNEGIVLASDRRTTYSRYITHDSTIENYVGIHVTNSTDKTFLCPNGVGISICGDASFINKPITGFIQDMIRAKIKSETKVSDIPQIIIDYFKESDTPNTTFLIAGYSSEQQLIYKLNLSTNEVASIDTSAPGAVWDGEASTLTRLIQPLAIKSDSGIYQDLPNEEILWNYFTLQDAVDFARFAVETTIQTMRFKNVIETVGGAVDILVITPDATKWLQKESLH